MMMKSAKAAVLVALGLAAAVSACSETKSVFPTRDKNSSAPQMGTEKRETIFGDEGILGGSSKKNQGDGAGIGVNAFLWRASLDTIAFMPIASADAFGGTIITDWYTLPESPSERFKLNVFIMDKALRADGVKVSVFKQMRDTSGQWIDIKTDPRMAADLENSILTRARQLRIVSSEQ